MPGKRREREREQRRKTILRAARKLFFKQGYNPVTVADIAKKAELSKGAIYLYFNSKEEICAQILLDDIERFHAEVLPIFKGEDSASEVLTGFANIYVDFFLRDRELFRILMNFMMHANSLNLSEITNKRMIVETNRAISVTENIFKFGIEKGEFLLRFEDVRVMRNSLWGMLNGIISLHLFVGREATREQRLRYGVNKSLGVFIEGLKKSE
ncbi:MAG: TetR/AcrR family transcriptional regulator [Thermodesulfobacteriota bacterium]|nr:TetR/AcrR family transcriptional regulator [Thermodesulfobacteriota bacterium]